MTEHLMHNYARQDVTFTRGEGAVLWDTNGKDYLDALGGIAVCGLGHAHPAITKAICEQAGQLIHTSNLYGIEHQTALADKLCALSKMDNAFFCNSGAEANEAAIKLARLYGHTKDIEEPHLIVMDNSFHGRTLATLTATGNRKVHAGFEPLVKGFVRAPYNDVEAIEAIAQNNQNVVGILVEPILGESGIQIPDEEYLVNLRRICDENDWLLMLDEIQTGMGRTGQWFAHQHKQITPDVMTLAKSLGNGVPIGACLAKGKAAELFQPGHHGSTFGGNPLACRAALAVCDSIEKDDLLKRAVDLGQALLSGFSDKLSSIEGVVEIRGKGLMLAIELDQDCTELVKLCLEQGVLINVAAGNRVRLLPPLILSDEQADKIVDVVSQQIIRFLSK